MISDFVLFVTLLVNAGAVLNFKFSKKGQSSFVDEDEYAQRNTLGEKIKEFLRNLRYFRVFIALWNMFIIVCMFLFFGG